MKYLKTIGPALFKLTLDTLNKSGEISLQGYEPIIPFKIHFEFVGNPYPFNQEEISWRRIGIKEVDIEFLEAYEANSSSNPNEIHTGGISLFINKNENRCKLGLNSINRAIELKITKEDLAQIKVSFFETIPTIIRIGEIVESNLNNEIFTTKLIDEYTKIQLSLFQGEQETNHITTFSRENFTSIYQRINRTINFLKNKLVNTNPIVDNYSGNDIRTIDNIYSKINLETSLNEVSIIIDELISYEKKKEEKDIEFYKYVDLYKNQLKLSEKIFEIPRKQRSLQEQEELNDIKYYKEKKEELMMEKSSLNEIIKDTNEKLDKAVRTFRLNTITNTF